MCKQENLFCKKPGRGGGGVRMQQFSVPILIEESKGFDSKYLAVKAAEGAKVYMCFLSYMYYNGGGPMSH